MVKESERWRYDYPSGAQSESDVGRQGVRTSFQYDAYGNPTLVDEYSLTVSPSPPYSTLYARYRYRELTYRHNLSKWLLGLVATEDLLAADGARQGGTWRIYDNNTSQVPQGGGEPLVGELRLLRQKGVRYTDGLGSVVSTADTSYAYDAWGNRTGETAYAGGGLIRAAGGSTYGTVAGAGTAGSTTSVEYDPTHSLPQTVTYPLASHGSASFTYNHLAKLDTQSDPNNALTSYGYDAFGRLTKLWRPGEVRGADPANPTHPATVVYAYDDAVRPAKLTIQRRTDVGGASPAVYHTTVRYFDGLGRLVQEKVAAEGGQYIETSFGYDGLGRKERESVPVYAPDAAYRPPNWATLKATSYSYDALDRVLSVTPPEGAVGRTLTAYDLWTTKVLDANGHRRESARDAFGRLSTVRECAGTYADNAAPCANPATTTYRYNVSDCLTLVTDATQNGLQTSIEYDLLGRKVDLSDPDLGAWSYRYDARGNLRKQSDARGVVLLFAYDAESRLTSKGTPAGEAISASGLSQLRGDVNARRLALGYAAFNWTDPTLSPSVRVRAVHFQELRDALRGIAGLGNLQYTAGEPSSSRALKASDLADLRRWVYGDETFGQPLAMSASFAYDETTGGNAGRGRRTGASVVGGPSGSYQYDARGRLSEEKQTVDGTLYQTSYSYDALDRVRSLTYPKVNPADPSEARETVSFEYGGRTLLSSVGSYLSSLQYSELGRPTSMVNGRASPPA